MIINVFCSKHKNVRLDARLVLGGDNDEGNLEIDPCPECHAVDEWQGYQDGKADRKKEAPRER